MYLLYVFISIYIYWNTYSVFCFVFFFLFKGNRYFLVCITYSTRTSTPVPESLCTVLFTCSLILIVKKINANTKDVLLFFSRWLNKWVGPKSVSPCQNNPLLVIHHQESTTVLLPLIVAANMWQVIWAINCDGKSLIGKQVTKPHTPEVLRTGSLCWYKPDRLLNYRLCFKLSTERQTNSGGGVCSSTLDENWQCVYSQHVQPDWALYITGWTGDKGSAEWIWTH